MAAPSRYLRAHARRPRERDLRSVPRGRPRQMTLASCNLRLASAPMRILLLEDDGETADALAKGLEKEGHKVSSARDVAAASALIASTSFDAAVLDVMVPGGSGYDVLAQLQRAGAAGAGLDAHGARRGSGSRRGPRPRRGRLPGEALLVRGAGCAHSRARPAHPPEATRLSLGALELDLLRRSARVGDAHLDLTQIEFSLLATLLRARRRRGRPARAAARGLESLLRSGHQRRGRPREPTASKAGERWPPVVRAHRARAGLCGELSGSRERGVAPTRARCSRSAARSCSRSGFRPS